LASSRVRVLLTAVLFSAAACDGGAPPTYPTTPSVPGARPLLTAADSLAALGPAPVATLSDSYTIASAPGIPVRQGDVVTVSVTSIDNGRCETVTVDGAVSATLWTDIGTPTACGNSPAPVTLPAIPADGVLVFDLPLIANTATITGGGPTFQVAFEDGYDSDYNDIVLSVSIASNAEPRVTCTPAPMRGSEVSCSATGGGVTVKAWHFTEGNLTIDETTTSNVWSGPAVIDGDVSVDVEVNGTPRTLTTTFAVAARPWHWGPSQWRYTQGTGQLCFKERPVVGSPINYGWNRRVGSCDPGRISPDVTKNQTGGYTTQMVPRGPNRGVWYLTGVSYRMDTESQMNPEITSAGIQHPLTNTTQARACRTALGLKNSATVYVNFQMYNERCEGLSLAGMYAGIWAHEGMGTGAANNGHEAQGRIAASDPANDLYQILEGVWATSEAEMRTSVGNTVYPIESRITNQAASHQFVNNNWCGSVWMWSNSTNSYVTAQIVTANNNCI